MLNGIERGKMIGVNTFNFFKPAADGGAHAFFTVLLYRQAAAFFRAILRKRADQQFTARVDGLL